MIRAGPSSSRPSWCARSPDLIVTTGPETSLQAVVGASGFVPVIMIAINFDPLTRGYIPSLSRPGGNITGLVFQQVELAQKQVELLTQAFPDRTRLAILFDALSGQFDAAERTAKALSLQVQTLRLENPPYDLAAVFRDAAVGGAQMLLVLSSPFFLPHRARIVELANTHRLPSMFMVKHWAEAGGLMAYGADFPQMFRRAADYVAKIYSLRLHEGGIVKSSPQKIIIRGTDWRFLNELKRELKG
jgi:putative ABC transport system substrate-binding protein